MGVATGSGDGRIPVLLAGAGIAGAGAAVLPAGAAARFTVEAGVHAVGCACCVPRSDAARALARLFLARARGEVALFRRVIAVTASPAGRAAVTAAVTGDVLASARFRMAEQARPEAPPPNSPQRSS